MVSAVVVIVVFAWAEIVSLDLLSAAIVNSISNAGGSNWQLLRVYDLLGFPV